jgi:hypothetical protein
MRAASGAVEKTPGPRVPIIMIGAMLTLVLIADVCAAIGWLMEVICAGMPRSATASNHIPLAEAPLGRLFLAAALPNTEA